MNGYIGGLLGRTLGDAPLLRPRTPSLFEPAPAEPEPSPAPSLPGERVITKTVTAPGEVREREHIVREEVPVVHEQVREVERERTVIEERPVLVPQWRDRPSAAAWLQPAGTSREPRRAEATPLHAEHRSPEAAATPQPAPATEPGAIALPEPPPRGSGLQPARDGLKPVPTVNPVSTHIHHHAGTNVFVQRTLPRRIEHATRVEAAQPAVVDTAPDIRVTIGRVDVRAVVRNDAPRPGAREPQKPRLSLEDYLRGQR